MLGKRNIKIPRANSESGRFLKKAAQKLLPVWARGCETSTA
jgi:hypothetical protein